MCAYFTGDVLRQTGAFAEAIERFEFVIVQRPDELAVLSALAQTYLDLGRTEDVAGFVARAEDAYVGAVSTALRTMEASAGFRRLAWKTAADALFELSRRVTFVREGVVQDALAAIIPLLGNAASARITGLFSLIEGPSGSPMKGQAMLDVAIAAYDHRLSLPSQDDAANGSAWADLGLALHAWAQGTVDLEKKALAAKEAIGCMIEALKADAGNDAYWNALGIMSFVDKPKTAQHAFIKALEIDNKVSLSSCSYIVCVG
jgi:superkiller protein 3